MVKVSQKIVRDAQYEAQQRTVEVSLKPTLGKNLFSDVLVQAAAGSFNGHFETERFVHGQIREYTLRAASHWTDVRSVLPDNKVHALRSDSTVVHNEERIKEIPESVQYRAAAETIEQSIGPVTLPHVPKDLRVCVLAQMLHDLDVTLNSIEHQAPVQVKYTEDRANLKMRLALRRIAKAAGLSLITDSGTVQALNRLISSQAPSSKTLNSAQLDKKIFQENQSAIIVLALLSFLSKTELASKAFPYCGKSQIQYQKPCQSECFSPDKNMRVHGFELSKAEGFGTAPIWYQQAMATGPPCQASRWGKMSNNQGFLKFAV